MDDGRAPNGFLVVDAGGELLRRIARYIVRALPVANSYETGVLKARARLLASRRPIATVWRMDQVSIGTEGAGGRSGAEIAEAMVTVLKGNCDAVVAFEPDNQVFRLRASSGLATAITVLYRWCDLNEQQEKLRATWHWDRDAEQHCEWLGINPPQVAERNARIIGAALMFESQIIIADQYIGKSLCDDLLYDNYWIQQGCDEKTVFEEKWGPIWLESLCFLLSAWKRSASACGNTKPRMCTVRTAAYPEAWRDVLWFFVARSERFLAKCLGGDVRFEVLAQPLRKQAREELHPRYIFASTRAIQSDRGFDLVQRKKKLTFRYAEIASRTRYEARHSRNSWTGAGLIAIPRDKVLDTKLVWMPSMTNRSPRLVITPPEKQAGGSEVT